MHLLLPQWGVLLGQKRRQAVGQQVVHGVGGRGASSSRARGAAGAAAGLRQVVEEQHGTVHQLYTAQQAAQQA